MEIPIYEQGVVFPKKEGEISLGIKADKIGEGARNGYGGNIEGGETIEECAIRETEEECTIIGKVADLKKIAVVDGYNTKNGQLVIYRVHFYLLEKFTGTPTATKEMFDPQWFDINNLPFDKMMLADKDWLPRALSGEQLYVKAFYGPKQKSLLRPTEVLPLSEFEKS